MTEEFGKASDLSRGRKKEQPPMDESSNTNIVNNETDKLRRPKIVRPAYPFKSIDAKISSE